jgi:hypothetical protein
MLWGGGVDIQGCGAIQPRPKAGSPRGVRASFAKTRTPPQLPGRRAKGGVSGTLIWLGEPSNAPGLRFRKLNGAPKVPHGASRSLLLDNTPLAGSPNGVRADAQKAPAAMRSRSFGLRGIRVLPREPRFKRCLLGLVHTCQSNNYGSCGIVLSLVGAVL